MSALVITTAALASTICTTTREHYTATLQCPTGTVIKKVGFASYGKPYSSVGSTDDCSSFTIGLCHSKTTQSVVEDLCLGKNKCSVLAENSLLTDPCVGTYKDLYISVDCGGTAEPSIAPSPAPSPPSTAELFSSFRSFSDWYCSGGDLAANCWSNGGMYDAETPSLEACQALCVSDPACGAVSYLPSTGPGASGGLCSKKCSISVGLPSGDARAVSYLFSPGSTCSFLAHSTRVTKERMALLPTMAAASASPAPPDPDALPSPSPFLSKLTSYVHFTPRPEVNTASFYTVPSRVSAIEVALYGAGGNTLQSPAFGGAGAFVNGYLQVTPGEKLRIIAGRAGSATAGELDGSGGRGFVGNNKNIVSNGGGYSAIQRQGSDGVYRSVVIAAGGGGSCYSYSDPQPHGGAGSFNGTGQRGTDLVESIFGGGDNYTLNGLPVELDPFGPGGGGGSLLQGGRSGIPAANASSYGKYLKGGDFSSNVASFYGSGGGGGYFGGAAGLRCRGGGGGSSLISNLIEPSGETASPNSHYLSGGRKHPGYLSGYGDRDSHGHVAIGVPPPCDKSGACYKGFNTAVNWTTAQSTCRAIGEGWDLATAFDSETWNSLASASSSSITGGCGGTILTDSFWIGLHDPSRSNRGRSTDATSTNWKWSSGVDASWFRSKANSSPRLWLSGEPNNGGWGDEFCVHVRSYTGLNDENCKSLAPFCCAYLPPGVNPSASRTSTPTPSPSSSVSPSVSVSASSSVSPTRSATGTPTGSPSTSPSPSLSPSVTASGSASASPSISASITSTPSPSSTPKPREERCGLGTSIIRIDKPGTLLISTPAAALNGTVISTLSCLWVITAPRGYKVSISFLAYAAQPSLDFLSAFDGATAADPTLLYMADSANGWAPRPITSSGSSLTLWFQSTNYRSSKGIIAVPAFIPIDASLPSSVGGASDGNALSQPIAGEAGAAPPATSMKSGASSMAINTEGYQSIYRCGPALTTGVVNATGTLLVTSPGLPLDPTGAGRVVVSPNVDCSVMITAPRGFVVALSFLNFTLSPSLDFFSAHDGASAASPPLIYQATGAVQPRQDQLASPPSEAEKNATHLPPVLLSSTSMMLVRFQSVKWDTLDAATGRPRGVTAVVNFISAPKPTSSSSSSSSSSASTVTVNSLPADKPTKPIVCVKALLKQRPWNNAPNKPNYQIGRRNGWGAFLPQTVNVTGLRGQTISIGYRFEGNVEKMSDGGSFKEKLKNCRLDCSKTDPLPEAVGNAELIKPGFYRKRHPECGLTGSCLFLYSFADRAGKLLDAPFVDMTSPVVVPPTASLLNMGYDDIDFRDNSGAADICLYKAEAQPSPSVTASPSAMPTPSNTPLPRDVDVFVKVTVTIAGPDATACLESKGCVNAAVKAVQSSSSSSSSSSSNVAVTSTQLIAAGAGSPPGNSGNGNSNNNGNGNGNGNKKRALLSSLTPQSGRRFLLANANGEDDGLLSDDLTAALLSAVSKDNLPLWLTLQLGLKDAPASSSGGRMLAASSPDVLAQNAIDSVNDALASGAFSAAFAQQLETVLANDLLGEGANTALYAFLNGLKTNGGTTASVASVAKIAGTAASPTPSPSSDGGGLSSGAIAAIACVVLAVAGLGVGIAIYRYRKASGGSGSSSGGGGNSLAVKSARAINVLATAVASGAKRVVTRPKEPSLVEQSQGGGRYDNKTLGEVHEEEIPGQVEFVSTRPNPIHEQRKSQMASGAANSLASSRAVYAPSGASQAAATGSPRKSQYGAPPIKMQASV